MRAQTIYPVINCAQIIVAYAFYNIFLWRSWVQKKKMPFLLHANKLIINPLKDRRVILSLFSLFRWWSLKKKIDFWANLLYQRTRKILYDTQWLNCENCEGLSIWMILDTFQTDKVKKTPSWQFDYGEKYVVWNIYNSINIYKIDTPQARL